MTAPTEYAAAIRDLDRSAKRAVQAAEAVQSADLGGLRLTAHYIARVADNLPPSETPHDRAHPHRRLAP